MCDCLFQAVPPTSVSLWCQRSGALDGVVDEVEAGLQEHLPRTKSETTPAQNFVNKCGKLLSSECFSTSSSRHEACFILKRIQTHSVKSQPGPSKAAGAAATWRDATGDASAPSRPSDGCATTCDRLGCKSEEKRGKIRQELGFA